MNKMMKIKCAECQCVPYQCKEESLECSNCTKEICCCIDIHSSEAKKPLSWLSSSALPSSSLFKFFSYTKELYAAALGIEILCIAAAEIGENTGLYLFGYNNAIGIPLGYVMGYTLAGFTTFASILGRYNYSSKGIICSCCSVLEQGGKEGFISNLTTTFRNFADGIKKIPQLYKQPDLKNILKTSLYILVTAESVCIFTAETINLVFYQYSLLLSVPLALLAGAFTVVAPDAYRKYREEENKAA
jgi:hypothetical protein